VLIGWKTSGLCWPCGMVRCRAQFDACIHVLCCVFSRAFVTRPLQAASLPSCSCAHGQTTPPVSSRFTAASHLTLPSLTAKSAEPSRFTSLSPLTLHIPSMPSATSPSTKCRHLTYAAPQPAALHRSCIIFAHASSLIMHIQVFLVDADFITSAGARAALVKRLQDIQDARKVLLVPDV
jgi:hypothetical protein